MPFAFVDHERLPRTTAADREKNVRLLSADEVRLKFGAPDDRSECREFLEGDDPEVRLYGDLDLEWPCEIREVDVRLKTAEVRRELDRVRDALAHGAPDGAPPVSYRLATRHGFSKSKGKWKMSFRPYFSGVRMRSSVARDVWAKFGNLEWDLAPFGKNRLLGMVNCAKGWSGANYDDRVLAPECPDDDPLLYVAQAVEEAWTVVSFDAESARHGSGGVAGAAFGCGDPDLVERVVAGIRKESDYSRWTRVGWAITFELGKTDRAREIFRAWSARAHNYDALACDKLVGKARTEGGCCCKMGTLLRYLEEDDPVMFEELGFGTDGDRQKKAAAMTADVQRRILEALSALYPEHFGSLDAGAEGHVKAGGDFLEFAVDDKKGRIDREYGVRLEDGTWVGALLNNTKVEGSLAAVHSSVPDDLRFVLERVTGDTHKFKSDSDDGNNATITWCSTKGGVNDSARVVVPGKRSATFGPKQKKQLDYIRHVARETLDHHAAMDSRLQVVHSVFNNVTIGVQNNILVTSDDSQRRHKGALCDLVASANPDIIQRLKCITDGASKPIFYACDPVTNLWRRTDHADLKHLILNKAVKSMAAFNDSELKYIFEHENDVINTVGLDHCLDKAFESKKLDSNPLLFAVENGVVDLRQLRFRQAEIEDFAGGSIAPWRYCPEEAAAYRSDLEAYIETVFPVPEEREVMLCFAAHTLSGLVDVKAFLMLTDTRKGNNGKSAWLTFLKGFFGERVPEQGEITGYAYEKKDLMLAQAASGKNSHEGGMKALMGVRLLIGDEFDDKMRLDTAFLRDIVNGASKNMYGRNTGLGSFFAFKWCGKLMLAFNDGSAPQLDNVEELFKRIIVIPFRSKFLHRAGPYAEDLTFQIDPDLSTRFPLWHSAFLDLLVEYFPRRKRLLEPLPEGCLQAMRRLRLGDNPLADTLADNVVIVDDGNDVLTQTEIINRLKTCWTQYRNYKSADIKKFIAAYFKAMGVYFKEDNYVKLDGSRSKAWHARNVRLVDWEAP